MNSVSFFKSTLTKQVFIFLCFVTFIACGNTSSKSKSQQPQLIKQEYKSDFPYISVPSYIVSQEDALDYVANNYWANYLKAQKDYSKDTALVGGLTKDKFQAAFQSYIEVLTVLEINKATKALESFLSSLREGVSEKLYIDLMELFELYLYNPNSNFRNEELYISVLNVILDSHYYTELQKDKYSLDLKDCSMNRIGLRAENFRFTTRNGETSSLDDLTTDYIIIFFSNPECEACFEIINSLSQNTLVNDLLVANKASILNLYIDQELEAWLDYMPIYPKEWINAYDPDMVVANVPLYNIRAIPTLYLLDKNKNVVLKDATLNSLLHTLSTYENE